MNPSDRTNDDKPALMALIPLALTIAAMFLALDALDLWARARYPQILSEAACRIWPYVWFARISVSSQAGYYVERACAGSPVDPVTTSIIFFVAKNAIAGLGVPLAWITVFTTSGLANRLKEDCFRSIESYRSYPAALVRMSIGAALSVLYPIVGIWLCGYPSTVEKFGTSLVHKLVEDHFAFFVFGVGWGVAELLLWFALYPLQREIPHPVDRRKGRNETVP
jgi:hypothetical protein